MFCSDDVTWPRGPTDKAPDYESGDSRFESWRGRIFFQFSFFIPMCLLVASMLLVALHYSQCVSKILTRDFKKPLDHHLYHIKYVITLCIIFFRNFAFVMLLLENLYENNWGKTYAKFRRKFSKGSSQI